MKLRTNGNRDHARWLFSFLSAGAIIIIQNQTKIWAKKSFCGIFSRHFITTGNPADNYWNEGWSETQILMTTAIAVFVAPWAILTAEDSQVTIAF